MVAGDTPEDLWSMDVPGAQVHEDELRGLVRSRRRDLRMSMPELAREAGIGRATLSGIELGTGVLRSLPMAAQLADALGLDRMVLVGRAVQQFPLRSARGQDFPAPLDESGENG